MNPWLIAILFILASPFLATSLAIVIVVAEYPGLVFKVICRKLKIDWDSL